MGTSLLLCSIGAANETELHALWSDAEAVRFTNFPHIPDLEGCRQRLARMLVHYGANAAHFGPFALRSADGVFLGLAGADALDAEAGRFEIWYFVARPYWRRGIASGAVAALLSMMRASGRVRAVTAEAAVDNEASWRLLEKAAFHRVRRVAAADTGHEKQFDRYVYVLNAWMEESTTP